MTQVRKAKVQPESLKLGSSHDVDEDSIEISHHLLSRPGLRSVAKEPAKERNES